MTESTHSTTDHTRQTFTAQQLSAILADHHLVIDAGAGSGKTTTLVEKIVYELGAEVAGKLVALPVDLTQIVAVTFTDAAAADLRRKLRARLREEASRTGESRWAAMVYEVDRAAIGTIHSFCSRVLRDYSLRIGLNPYFAVLEEHDAARRIHVAAQDTVLELLQAQDPMAIEVVSRCSKLENIVDPVRLAASDAQRAKACVETWCEMEGYKNDEFAERIRHLITEWDVKSKKEGGEEQTVMWNEETDRRQTEIAFWILRAGCRARDLMQQRCDAAGELDYDALITRTLEALGVPSVLDSLRSRFAWVFVDEFQDTDPMQLEIGYRLCGLSDGTASGTGPRLCVIGDPKQSIYRFRGADVSVWTGILQRFADIGLEPVHLTRNYRSRAPIMGFVNATFGALLGHGPQAVLKEGHEVSSGPLEAHREVAGDDSIVEVCTVSAKGTAPERRGREAAWIATRILQMVEHEHLVEEDVRRTDTQRTRTPRFGDIALLFRGRTGMELYEAALSKAGIPFVVNRGGGFFSERAVRDVRIVLEAIADPLDNLAWFGLLRSPFVGLRDETILRFALDNRYSPLSRILHQNEYTLESDVLERVRIWIESTLPLRDRVSVATLIRHVLATSGYEAQAMFRPDGDRAVANLHKLARLADGMLDADLTEFLELMSERAVTDSTEKGASLYTAGEDVVTLTTVHGAKGLEWPIVFLPDLGRDIVSTKSGSERLQFCPSIGVGINIPGVADSHTAHAVLRARERALSCAEEKRMWYVATTRARDYLVLCVPDGLAKTDDPAHVHDWLLRSLSATRVGDLSGYEYDGRSWHVRHSRVSAEDRTAPDGPVIDTQTASALPTIADVEAASGLGEDVAKRVSPVSVARRPGRRSATELMLLDKDPDAHRDKYVLGIRDRRLFHRGGDGKIQLGVAATIMGEVMHASLEEQLADADLDAFHERELSQRLGEPTSSARVRAAAEKLRLLVQATRSNPEVAKLYDSPSSERELPFTWIRHTDDGEAAIIQGAMDLVGTPTGGPVEILDFKSHALKQGAEKAKAAEYDLQRDLYAEALRAILGQDPSRFTFYFPETNGVVETDLNLESSEDRLARIDRLLTQDSAS